MLIPIGVNSSKISCSGNILQFEKAWYIVKKRKTEFLAYQWDLVDAGDYDNDGRSEIVFWYDDNYNRYSNGYILLYNGLQSRVENLVNYH